jgi:hypothetical protein
MGLERLSGTAGSRERQSEGSMADGDGPRSACCQQTCTGTVDVRAEPSNTALDVDPTEEELTRMFSS